MMPKVPMSDSGTTTPGISVARRLRRNRNTTMMTSAIEIIIVNSTSCTEARMVVVRSRTTVRSIADGIEALNWGNAA
jgi:hypothetical protein